MKKTTLIQFLLTLTLLLSANNYAQTPEIDVLQGGTSIADSGTDDMGDVPSVCFVSRTYTISNTSGSAALTVSTPTAANMNNAWRFSVTSLPPSSISAGSSGTFSINFVTGTGVFSFDMNIGNNDSNENPYDIQITGNGRGPEIDVFQSGNPIDNLGTDNLGLVPHGSVSRTYTNSNVNGWAPLMVSSPYEYNMNNAWGFSVTSPPPSSIPAGSTSTFSIKFMAGTGPFNFEMLINNNDNNENLYRIYINGQTPGPEIDIQRPPGTSLPCGWITMLHNVLAQTFVWTFTVVNDGLEELNISSPTVSEVHNISGFKVTKPPPGSLLAGSTDTFTIQFDVGTGGFSFNINIKNNDLNETPYSLRVTGVGTWPEINLKQDTNDILNRGTYSFPYRNIGHPKDKVFTIENLGIGELSITTPLKVKGHNADQFSIKSQSGTSLIPPGGNTALTVRFLPTSSGEKTAKINIWNSDEDENPY